MSAERAASALVWLAYALGDLEATRARRSSPQRSRIVAFNAQQAVEKALKGALVLEGVDPPRTHDLDELRNLLPAGWRVARRFPDLGRLSEYAVEARYPDLTSLVTPIQAATAVRQAIAIVNLVKEDIDRRGIDTSTVKPE